MQPRPVPSKPKYKIKDFAVTGNHVVNKLVFSPGDNSCKLYCICNNYSNSNSKTCKRCNSSYHSCVASSTKQSWQCLHCQSVFMDPIYMPDQILIETFFKTQSVFQCSNTIEFIFFLTQEQLKNPVQIRGLQQARQGLAWPMQGQIFLNKDQNPQSITDFKPLLKNSNRKHRKQQALLLPSDKLKMGKNILTFAIPKLNMATFQAKYQVQAKSIYFFGIYAIKKYSKEQLIQKTFQTSKIDKTNSLNLLKRLLSTQDSQLSVQKIKLCLQCPYMKSRIKIPVRGKSCLHYMCICLDTLIQTRSGLNSRQWLCPICSSSINQPVIDMFILSMLNDGNAGIQVVLYVTGQYQWIAFEENDDLSISSQQIVRKKQSIKQPTKTSIHKQKNTISLSVQEPDKKNIPRAIQMIDLDDDGPICQVPKNIVSNEGKGKNQKQKLLPFEIVVPEEGIKTKNMKQKQKNQQKQRLKQTLKQKKKKEINQVQFIMANPKKSQFLITDIRQLQFRPLNHNEFVKKYFSIQYNRNKISQDLKIIFKEVL